MAYVTYSSKSFFALLFLCLVIQLMFFFGFSHYAFANDTPDLGTPPAAIDDTPDLGTPPGGLTNPLAFGTLEAFLVAILDAIILILFPFLVLALVYAGFMFVTAQGKPEALAKARTAFLWVFIGALIILGAKAIAIAIEATVGEITAYEHQLEFPQNPKA